MTLHTLPRMVVIKKEEKESRLRELLAKGVAQGPHEQGTTVLRVLALSCTSPVVRAVMAARADLLAAGFETRLILAKTDDVTPFDRAAQLRVLADVRCHDAHEMLALGTTTAWIGDSMRREPATRDSFELHTHVCVTTAARVVSSFDKLWAHAQVRQTPCAELAAELDLAADLAGLTTEPASAPQVLTRH